MKEIEDVLREEGILTLDEASRLYGLSKSHLRNIIRGHIKSIEVEEEEVAYVGIWLIRESLLEKHYSKKEGKEAYVPELTGKEFKELIEKGKIEYGELSRETNIPQWKLVKFESKDIIPIEELKPLLEGIKSRYEDNDIKLPKNLRAIALAVLK